MKIEKKHIDQITKKFAAMQTKDDLVSLLSEAKKIMYGPECKPFHLQSITYYANPALNTQRYAQFSIKKNQEATALLMHR